MSNSNGERAPYVPACFEDLKRDTRPGRAPIRPVVAGDEGDLHALTAQGDFMRRSGLIAGGAAAFGVLLVLIAYARPLIQTFDAFGTAGQVASDKAGEQLRKVRGAAEGVASQAAFVKATDEKAINTARGGLDCLTGKLSCPHGTSSPFK